MESWKEKHISLVEQETCHNLFYFLPHFVLVGIFPCNLVAASLQAPCKLLYSEGDGVWLNEGLMKASIAGRCNTVWCSLVWCSIVWCSTMWCGIVWCSTMWFIIVWCSTVWGNIMRCSTIQCSIVWCSTMWCIIVWCSTV